MSEKDTANKDTWWDRLEAAGEGVDFLARVFLGVLFALVIATFVMWLGSHIWIGIGMILFLISFPFGFLIGYFWFEIRFVLSLLFTLFLTLVRAWIGL